MDWQVALLEPTKTVLTQIGGFLLSLIKLALILVVGWIIAKAIKNIIIRLLNLLRLDYLSSRIKADEFLAKGGITYSISELIGVISYWLVLLVALVIAINAIGLAVAADLLNRIVLYIPNIIAAIFILVLGMFVATFLSSIVKTTSVNAGISQAKLLAKLVEVVVVIFAIVITLEQLNIATAILGVAINIILASVGLALGLAFGLGCKDIAGKVVAEWLDKLKSKK